jgi:hypothetical protein
MVAQPFLDTKLARDVAVQRRHAVALGATINHIVVHQAEEMEQLQRDE